MGLLVYKTVRAGAGFYGEQLLVDCSPISHTVITLGLLISLLFPVNCSYLSQQSSPSVSPILLSSPAVRKQEEAKGEDTRSLVFSGNSKLRNTFSKP